MENEANTIKKVKTEIIRGKYHFSTEEKRAIANDLARKQIDRNIIEDERKSVMAGYKDRLDRFDWEINRASRNIVDGFEMRDFECRIEKDYDAHVKKYICVHTGDEIEQRPLDPSDYQQEMAL